ncbi:hypothetical protein OESDEN_03035 [Oesophagostomum dentatum]|uniref:Uncharacterized protein n=1 Tax=Oesophagostomum dentatum TaxID=61180 RepID=A0A0B1TMD5_OESDE|nr:hypothetical protein OESDEN_03035 [Oesophagostomum dentatum]
MFFNVPDVCAQSPPMCAALRRGARVEAPRRIGALDPAHAAQRADRLRLHVARGPIVDVCLQEVNGKKTMSRNRSLDDVN